jgi:hypothetical protein
MPDLIEHFRAATKGLRVSHVWRGYGSALFLELGTLTASTAKRRDDSQQSPSGEIGIMIEWSWRIEQGSSILCGSWSEESLWQPAFDLLVGQQVLGLSTFGRLPELALFLSNDFHVLSFMTAEGDPSWALFDRRDAGKSITVHCQSGAITRES